MSILKNKMEKMPLDLKLMILKRCEIRVFIVLCDLLGIDIQDNNIIKFIIANYCLEDYLKLALPQFGYDKFKINNYNNNRNDKNEDSDDYNKLYDLVVQKIKNRWFNLKNINQINDPINMKYNIITGIKSINELKILGKLAKNNKININWIIFDNKFNDKLSGSHLAELNINKLNINKFKNFDRLTNINFGDEFNSDISCLKIIKTLTHLTFGYNSKFNQPLDTNEYSLLPDNLTHLIFGSQSHFNMPINHLPPKLLYLKFDDNSFFNQKINYIPKSLEYLIFGAYFNKQFDHLYFYNLKYLSFGKKFNQFIDSLNCQNLNYLSLYECENYEYDIDFNNFNNLTHLLLSSKFMSHINILPKNLTHLKMCISRNINIGDNFPTKLEYLYLYLSHKVNYNHTAHSNLNNLKKLQYLKYLALIINNQPVENLPDNLEFLILGYHFNSSIDNLPNNIKYLELGSLFSQDIYKLPDKLETLKFIGNYDKPILCSPNNLKSINTLEYKIIFNNNLRQKINHY